MRSNATAKVLPIHTPALFNAAVDQAAELLRAGQLVALPTETVYGLAANALNAEAVLRIFTVKGRPPQNPIIVHVSSIAMAQRCVAHWPAVAKKLGAAFWPGPLTLVLPRGPSIPDIVTACGPTVGVRWPNHPFIQEVIRVCDFPLAAPSANLSEQVSPTTAGHVLKDLGDKIGLVIDGGPTQVGIESTVIDISSPTVRLLRPGMIHAESLLAVTGSLDMPKIENQESWADREILRSPGMLRRHYAPRARLVICKWQDAAELAAHLARLKFELKYTHILAHSRIPDVTGVGRVCVMPHEPAAFARAIYAELHRCDEARAKLIVVEELPKTDKWRAIADRLQRAAADF